MMMLTAMMMPTRMDGWARCCSSTDGGGDDDDDDTGDVATPNPHLYDATQSR